MPMKATAMVAMVAAAAALAAAAVVAHPPTATNPALSPGVKPSPAAASNAQRIVGRDAAVGERFLPI